jgi:hypothetical protein
MATATTRHREQVDAPELGASVFLNECTVGEMMPLLAIAESGDTYRLMIAALSATLEIDGKRQSTADLEGMNARKLKTLMKLGPRALQINSIIPEDDAEKNPNR